MMGIHKFLKWFRKRMLKDHPYLYRFVWPKPWDQFYYNKLQQHVLVPSIQVNIQENSPTPEPFKGYRYPDGILTN